MRVCKTPEEAVNYAILLSVMGHARVEIFGFPRTHGDVTCLVGASSGRATPPPRRTAPLLGTVHPGGHADERLVRWYTQVYAVGEPRMILGLIKICWRLWFAGPIDPLVPETGPVSP